MAERNLRALLLGTAPLLPGGGGGAGGAPLGEFWARFREWSAFGAPVELEIESGAAVTQFYVPYLSGLQLYRRSPGGGGEAAGDVVRAEEGPPAGVGSGGGGQQGRVGGRAYQTLRF